MTVINSEKTYNSGITLIKGLLILLMIMGHTLVGTMPDTLSRTIIYAFHMPLFIGLSGYLFNFDSYIQNPKKIVSFFRRCIAPWTLALILYILLGYQEKTFYLYYHLWYIPAYVFYILAIYIHIKSELKPLLYLAISLYMYILYMYDRSQNPQLLNIFLHNIRLYNLIFFTIGYLWRKKQYLLPINGYTTLISVLLLAFNVFSAHTYGYAHLLSMLSFYISNIYLIIYILSFCSVFPQLAIKPLSLFGTYSLSIYLYHILIEKYIRLFIANQYLRYTVVILIIYVLWFAYDKLYKYFNNRLTW